jgi:hypothetical protein
MSIKCNCPNCKQAFNVKDDLGGKKAQCSTCKQVFVIPVPTAQPADLEQFAAAALADRSTAQEPPKPQAQIEFVCFYCDSRVHVSAELAGKQTSCPECRRIVKVPQLEKREQKDWRKLDPRMPAGARRDAEPAPEGMWASRTLGSVSVESLIQAEAIPQTLKKLTWQQKARRGAVVVAGLAVVASFAWVLLFLLAQNREKRAVALALEYADGKDKVNGEAAAALNTFLGDYFLRASKVTDARSRFQRARADIIAAPQTSLVTPDFLLRDLALAQIDLGGDKLAVEQGTHIGWNDAFKEIRQTLQNLRSPPGRVYALRAVTRKLIENEQGRAAGSMASLFAQDASELLSVVGLELLRAGQDAEAKLLAEQALGRPQAEGPGTPNDNPAPPPQSPSAALVALQIALGKISAETALASLRAEKKDPDPSLLLGVVEGLTWQGKLEQARTLAASAPTPATKLEAAAALIKIASEKGQGEAVIQDFDKAAQLAEFEKGRPGSGWEVYRLVRAGQHIGLGSKAHALIQYIGDPDLRAWAGLEFLLGELAAEGQPPPESMVETIDKNFVARGLAVEAIFHHNVRRGGAAGDALRSCADLEPTWLRPFGLIGIARGLQDPNK